jgi:branched chain amino acid efflux pump
MWTGILVGALSCYLLKLAGLSVPQRVLADRRVLKIAELLPVALLAALTVTQTLTKGQQIEIGVPAAAVGAAVVAVWFRAPFLVVVGIAAVGAALLRLVI